MAKKITTFHIKGDYGGRKGIYNPSWWSESNTQYGEYKRFTSPIRAVMRTTRKHRMKRSKASGLLDGYSFSFTLKVDPDSTNVGGMNLFGKHFGDYAQDIVMKVEYEND